LHASDLRPDGTDLRPRARRMQRGDRVWPVRRRPDVRRRRREQVRNRSMPDAHVRAERGVVRIRIRRVRGRPRLRGLSRARVVRRRRQGERVRVQGQDLRPDGIDVRQGAGSLRRRDRMRRLRDRTDLRWRGREQVRDRLLLPQVLRADAGELRNRLGWLRIYARVRQLLVARSVRWQRDIESLRMPAEDLCAARRFLRGSRRRLRQGTAMRGMR